jgi:hypothetical protein
VLASWEQTLADVPYQDLPTHCCPAADAFRRESERILAKLEQVLPQTRVDQRAKPFAQAHKQLWDALARAVVLAFPGHRNAHNRTAHPCLLDLLRDLVLPRLRELEQDWCEPDFDVRAKEPNEERPLLAFGIERGG